MNTGADDGPDLSRTLLKVIGDLADPEPGADGLADPGGRPESFPEGRPRPAIQTHAEVLRLVDDSDWQTLHERYRRPGNPAPWYRCLGVLRGHLAACVVIEHYYVCLDHKSEYAAFYAHLDAPATRYTTRLHFFDREVTEADVPDLTQQQALGYLGYVVCRGGELPLVGRCVIKVPESYVQQSTAITDSVNFFGQTLTVRGVPFMQQDERFAVCAHVGIWVSQFSAYRRGVSERRLIADIVNLDGHLQPLRPRADDGLTAKQVAVTFSQIGFRPTSWATPNATGGTANLPELTAEDLPVEDQKALLDLLSVTGEALAEEGGDIPRYVSKAFSDAIVEAALTADADQPDSPTASNAEPAPPPSDTAQALHRVIDHLVAPYIESGWPVYCGTDEHAVVLCGRSVVDGYPYHFVHDDQSGPYLLAEALPVLSSHSLHYQSGTVDSDKRRIAYPPEDVVLTSAKSGFKDLRRKDESLGVSSLVIATPSRVLLSPAAARRKTRDTLASLRVSLQQPPSHIRAEIASVLRELLAPDVSMRVTILMGIDYKHQRRAEARRRHDQDAKEAFSGAQFAEWVVAVECVDPTGRVHGDFVYDASSSDQAPRLQLGRVRNLITAEWPVDGTVEMTQGSIADYDRIVVPARVGKVVPDPPTDARADAGEPDAATPGPAAAE